MSSYERFGYDLHLVFLVLAGDVLVFGARKTENGGYTRRHADGEDGQINGHGPTFP